MNPDPRTSMENACHALAEYILRFPARTNRCKWLRAQVAKELSGSIQVSAYNDQYRREYPYADAPTEYLAAVLRAYDEEAQ